MSFKTVFSALLFLLYLFLNKRLLNTLNIDRCSNFIYNKGALDVSERSVK